MYLPNWCRAILTKVIQNMKWRLQLINYKYFSNACTWKDFDIHFRKVPILKPVFSYPKGEAGSFVIWRSDCQRWNCGRFQKRVIDEKVCASKNHCSLILPLAYYSYPFNKLKMQENVVALLYTEYNKQLCCLVNDWSGTHIDESSLVHYHA